MRVLRGRCLSYGQGVSLWLVADLLRSLCGLREDEVAEALRAGIAATVDPTLAACDAADRAIARDVLGEVLGLPPGGSLVGQAGPQVRRQALVRILGLLLDSLADRGPQVLVLEDLHWLDAASREVLMEVLGEVPARPMLVLATRRPEGEDLEMQGAWVGRLELRPLGEGEAAALAGAVLGGMPLAPELEGYLRERAAGNPFYLEELLRFLQESGGLDRTACQVGLVPGRAEKVPSTLAEVLLARLDRLEGQVKGVAQVGSVIGRSFAVRLLARVLDREEAALEAPLLALQRAEIAFPLGRADAEYIFKHILLRDAAYGMLVQRRRRQLHLLAARAIAQLYSTDEYVEMIAYHYARTEEDAEAARWLERAGDRARDTYANDTAIEHYRDALERLERCGTEAAARAGVEVKLGDVLYWVARWEEAQEVLERAAGRYREAGDREGTAAATARMGFVVMNRGDLEGARRTLEGMEAELAGAGPSPARARLQLYLASIFQSQGRYGEMLGAAQRAGEMARALGDDGLRGWAEGRRGTALYCLGRMEEAREALERAIPLLEGAGDLPRLATALGSLGESRRLAGDLPEALRLNQRALELAARTGRVAHEGFYHLNLAEILLAMGEWARAREQVARAERSAGTRGHLAYVAPFGPILLGELALREGDWEEAAGQLGRAAELAGANRGALESAQTRLGELEILQGKPGEARERLGGWSPRKGPTCPCC